MASGQDGRLSTKQIPREIVLSILAKVNHAQPQRATKSGLVLDPGRMVRRRQTGARYLLRDFPEDASLRDTIGNARTVVAQLESSQIKAELDDSSQGSAVR